MKKCVLYISVIFASANILIFRIRMSTILGAKSGYPCPICLVPRDQQHVLGNVWPLRTPEGTNSLVSLASAQGRKKDKTRLLKQQSLRPIEVSEFFID